MRLTFVVPDLLWPRQVLSDTIFDLRLPATETLLGWAEVTPVLQRSAYAWWLAAFGLAPPMPSAPLRLIDLGRDPAERWWLCADPVHLRIEQQGALIEDPQHLELTAAEATELAASLSPILAPLGQLQCDTPSAWHLAMAKAPPATIGGDEPPSNDRPVLTAGEDARPWRRALNEAQMALHAHPVNRAREAAGRPVVNSLALWGPGAMPKARNPGFDRVFADDAVIRGLARSAGVKTDPLPHAVPVAPGTGTQEHWAVHLDRLVAPTRSQDALHWREALSELENRWFVPLLESLKAGSLKSCAIVALGTEGGLQLALQARDRYKFWRRPRPLASIAP